MLLIRTSFIGELVDTLGGEGGNGVKRVEGSIVILANCEYHCDFVRVHENLVPHPSN